MHFPAAGVDECANVVDREADAAADPDRCELAFAAMRLIVVWSAHRSAAAWEVFASWSVLPRDTDLVESVGAGTQDTARILAIKRFLSGENATDCSDVMHGVDP